MDLKAIVIGSGIGGIATAIRLRSKGYKVKVFEKNSYPGGKLTEIRKNNFRFDAGPSLFTQPENVDELFQICGKNPRDYFNYTELDTVGRYFYEDGTTFCVTSDVIETAKNISEKTNDDEKSIIGFLKKSAFLYNSTSDLFLNRPLNKIKSYFHFDVLKGAVKAPWFDLNQSMNTRNKKWFNDPKTIQFFNRYATYNGSNPYQASAILNIIPHLEFNQGAYLPLGGMHDITASLFRLAKDIGVDFHFSSEVEEVLVQRGQVSGVTVKDQTYLSDVIVSNVDVEFFYKNILKNEKLLSKLEKGEKSSSGFVFYWGMEGVKAKLELHNIFFSKDYKSEFKSIFGERKVYNDPTIYINITSKLNESDAPIGCENWFVMINVPSSTELEWGEIKEQVKENILSKLERVLGEDLRTKIVTEEVLSPEGISIKTNAVAGAIYGQSSNDKMSAFKRHQNSIREYKNLYFVGGTVHPGGGIPLALSSAKIVSEQV